MQKKKGVLTDHKQKSPKTNKNKNTIILLLFSLLLLLLLLLLVVLLFLLLFLFLFLFLLLLLLLLLSGTTWVCRIAKPPVFSSGNSIPDYLYHTQMLHGIVALHLGKKCMANVSKNSIHLAKL